LVYTIIWAVRSVRAYRGIGVVAVRASAQHAWHTIAIHVAGVLPVTVLVDPIIGNVLCTREDGRICVVTVLVNGTTVSIYIRNSRLRATVCADVAARAVRVEDLRVACVS
jgi:hypothetical protein